jgi:hypothetical protein
VSLVAVLVATVAIAGAALAASVAATDALAASRNRLALAQAEWQAEGCAVAVRAQLARQMTAAAATGVRALADAWAELDTRGLPSRISGCSVSLRPAGTLAAAYAQRAGRIASATDIEGPVNLRHAPTELLALLPGFDVSLAGTVVSLREAGLPVADMASLVAVAPLESRDGLARAVGLLSQLVTFAPIAWVMRVETHAGTPSVGIVLEEHILHHGTRVVGVHHRRWAA